MNFNDVIFHFEYKIEKDSWDVYIFKKEDDGFRRIYKGYFEITGSERIPPGCEMPKAFELPATLGNALIKNGLKKFKYEP